jgi:arylsulfatase A-like enzyme
MSGRLRRVSTAVTVVAALLSGVCANAADQGGSGKQVTRRPNILLIISDDVGMDVSTSMYPGLIEGLTRQYGPSGLKHPQYQAIQGRPASTPHLDQLARQGMVFSNTWAEPFCSPTRASILTGLFASKARVLSYADPLSQHYTSFVQQLKDEAGYSTGLFGKWHLAGLPGNPVSYPGMKPKQAGFDSSNNLRCNQNVLGLGLPGTGCETPADQWRRSLRKVGASIASTTFAPVVMWLMPLNGSPHRRPPAPTSPGWRGGDEPHATRQQPSAMAVPNADTLDAASLNEMRACGGTFGSNNTGSCSGEALMRAMTNSLDTLLGKLLEAVDAADPNTYVIYVGDNGTPMYGRPNLDFIDNMYITRKGRGKGTTYESGARVPLAVRGPGIAANKASDEYVHTADLFSTVLSLAGLTAPANVSNSDGTGKLSVDGVSLAPILTGKATHVRDPNEGYLLTQSLNLMTNSTRQVGARNATYKVVCTESAPNRRPASSTSNSVVDPSEEFRWKAGQLQWKLERGPSAVALLPPVMKRSASSLSWRRRTRATSPGVGRRASAYHGAIRAMPRPGVLLR